MSRETDTSNAFVTPEGYIAARSALGESNRGPLLIAACRSGRAFHRKVIARYRELLTEAGSDSRISSIEDIDGRFDDSETIVRLDRHVGGYDVYLIQNLFDPSGRTGVDQNYMSFIIAARALKEHGAGHVTGILPYLAYSRQDKPTKNTREPTTAQLMADLCESAGMDRIVTWHPHSAAIHGFYGRTPVHALDSLHCFTDAFQALKGRRDVIVVAPDTGAADFVTRFCRALDLKGALASKLRPEPGKAEITEIIGDFSGKTSALVLDDMIAGGGTLSALNRRLVEEKGVREVHVAVSHGLFVGDALRRLQTLHEQHRLASLTVTDSISPDRARSALPFLKVFCLADDLARVVNRIHYNRSVSAAVGDEGP